VPTYQLSGTEKKKRTNFKFDQKRKRYSIRHIIISKAVLQKNLYHGINTLADNQAVGT
jgi:hypothetical protein